MEFFRYYDESKFQAFVPKIKQSLKEWQIVEVLLTGKTSYNVAYIARKLQEYFAQRDGVIFICNQMEILVFVHMGKTTAPEELTNDLSQKMPKYSCTAEATDITAEGILRVQIRLQDIQEQEKKREIPAVSSLLAIRRKRQEPVILVADDDMFMRSLISKNFKSRGKVLELPDARGVVDTYLEALPDIVFLDIHMPGGSGIDVLSEILKFDETAYVVMLSSDSIKDNVLGAQKLGAKSFIAKPFTKEKLDACFETCLASMFYPRSS
jgi:two-component system chemotaxis response regulator CheY